MLLRKKVAVITALILFIFVSTYERNTEAYQNAVILNTQDTEDISTPQASPAPTTLLTITPAPTKDPTPVPSQKPAAESPAPIKIQLAADVKYGATPPDLTNYSEAQMDEFFRDAAYIGDSVTLGFRNFVRYRRRSNPGFMSNLTFLTEGSLGIEPLVSCRDFSILPLYEGERRPVEDSLNQMRAKKVFIMLGLNQICLSGTEGSLDLYKQLFDKIQDKNPGIQIYVVSMTYLNAVTNGTKGKLNNDNARAFNNAVKTYAAETDHIFYIEVANYLADESGCLKQEYCSDNYCHINMDGYEIMAAVLRAYGLNL